MSARTVSANWSNLTDYSRNKDEITQLIVNPLDRSLRAMKDNLASQEFVVDDTGILGRKKEKSGDFSSEQLRIVNNTLMFTKDNWNTASLALGKVGNKYGLVADVIVGTLLMGEELQIKNSSNTISLDENGIAVYNSSNTQVFKASTKGDVYIKGKVEATSGKIGKIDIRNDGSIISANGNFIVDANGNLTASSATIKGNVTATSGTIGGYSIGNKTLSNGTVGMCSSTDEGSFAFWAGNSSAASAPFSVTNDGALTATNANISGVITATSGKIGGLTIGESSISSGGEGLTFMPSGEILCKSIQTESDFKAGAIKVKTISGRTDGGCSLDFEGGTTNATTTIKVSAHRRNYNTAYQKVWVTSDKVLRFAKTFEVIVTYAGVLDTRTQSIYITIPAGQQKSAEENVYASNSGINLSGVRTVISEYQEVAPETTPNAILSGNLLPKEARKYSLGTEDIPWNEIWSINGSVQGSDKNLKREIHEVGNAYSKFFDGLKPKSFKWKDGARTHIGFIAQEVKDALDMSGLDTAHFAGYCSWKDVSGKDGFGLRMSEFVPLCVMEIQRLKKELRRLNQHIKT